MLKPLVASKDDLQSLTVCYLWRGINSIIKLSAGFETTRNRVTLLRRVSGCVDGPLLYELTERRARNSNFGSYNPD